MGSDYYRSSGENRLSSPENHPMPPNHHKSSRLLTQKTWQSSYASYRTIEIEMRSLESAQSALARRNQIWQLTAFRLTAHEPASIGSSGTSDSGIPQPFHSKGFILQTF
jgi:hypothetical protein